MPRTLASLLVTAMISGLSPAIGADLGHTRIGLREGRWMINDRPTNPGSAAEGLLMNVRMVNAVFEDRNRPEFDPEANTDELITRIPDYAAQGVNAFTICLQGGMPGYEGAVNSAFEPEGGLRPAYLARVERLIQGCDRHGVAVILGLYYQRQSAILRDETAVRTGVVNAARWVRERGFRNVLLEVANEYPHSGFVHSLICDPKGQAGLIRLAKETAPGVLVSASGYGDGRVHREVAEAADFLLPHWNGTTVEQIPERIAALKKSGKPIVCNEDDKTGTNAVAALLASVKNGASYGLMLKEQNQTFPFHFNGAADDPVFYAQLRALTAPASRAGTQAVKGLLQVHPSNRRYFTDGATNVDGSLRAVYLTGSHHWNNLQDSAKLGAPLTNLFDYDGYLARLAKLNHNFIRMWSWEVGENDLYYEPAPWVRAGPGRERARTASRDSISGRSIRSITSGCDRG